MLAIVNNFRNYEQFCKFKVQSQHFSEENFSKYLLLIIPLNSSLGWTHYTKMVAWFNNAYFTWLTHVE